MQLKFVSLLAEPIHGAYRELCRELTNHGFAVEFCEMEDWRDARLLLEYGEAQVGAICGLLYTLLRAQGINLDPIASPILDNPRYQSPHYWTDLVVRADSPIGSFEDLKGRDWLFNEVQSFSGYRCLLSGLHRRGLEADTWGQALETGAHQESFHRLLQGDADFTGLDSTFLDYLPDTQRQKVRVVESLGPTPAPLLVGQPAHAAAFWEACQKLPKLPAPFSRFQAVGDQDYQPLRTAWNDSLHLNGGHEQWFLTSPETWPGKEFTSPQQRAKDLAILSGIGRELSTRLEAKPTKILPNGPAFHLSEHEGLQHHVYLINPEELHKGDLTIVGFLSKMKPSGDLAALFEADDRLIEQFHLHDGFLSYSPTEYEPGLWANLAVFRNLKARENWAANDTHLKAIRELGADSYDNVRLHLGVWPSLDQPQQWLATRYLHYTEEGLWRGVRA